MLDLPYGATAESSGRRYLHGGYHEAAFNGSNSGECLHFGSSAGAIFGMVRSPQ